MSALGNGPGMVPHPAHALTPSGNLRRRQVVSRLFVGGTVGSAGLAVAVLFILIYYAAKHGAGQLNLSFLTAQLPAYGGIGGGMGPALVGTVEVILIATIIALPVGLLTAIYLSEFAGRRIGAVLTTALEQMAGLPTILAGVFIAGLIVMHYGQSAIAAGLALSIVEVPLIARASTESLRRVPGTMREAADALGVARWRTILGVILPTAANGIVTATILAVARAAGETAPVLLTSNAFQQAYQLDPRHAVATVPMEILVLLNSGVPSAVDKAWGAAFLLMGVILVVNIGARVWLRRSERKRGI
ncbi:MAG TPA: phosphate ABC transporter permease PstA [Solirubrobacteraceae bacterium]|jgi:phosphate transport system permease protein|nr:phosphate ABC transporter permease PstA [Solirubrobacteraceae bacterium]